MSVGDLFISAALKGLRLTMAIENCVTSFKFVDSSGREFVIVSPDVEEAFDNAERFVEEFESEEGRD